MIQWRVALSRWRWCWRVRHWPWEITHVRTLACNPAVTEVTTQRGMQVTTYCCARTPPTPEAS